MTEKKRAKPLVIDMGFDEALERFAGVDPGELPDRVKLSHKRGPPGSPKPPGGKGRKEKAKPPADRER